MTWWHKEPGHQQASHWSGFPENLGFSTMWVNAYQHTCIHYFISCFDIKQWKIWYFTIIQYCIAMYLSYPCKIWDRMKVNSPQNEHKWLYQEKQMKEAKYTTEKYKVLFYNSNDVSSIWLLFQHQSAWWLKLMFECVWTSRLNLTHWLLENLNRILGK